MAGGVKGTRTTEEEKGRREVGGSRTEETRRRNKRETRQEGGGNGGVTRRQRSAGNLWSEGNAGHRQGIEDEGAGAHSNKGPDTAAECRRQRSAPVRRRRANGQGGRTMHGSGGHVDAAGRPRRGQHRRETHGANAPASPRRDSSGEARRWHQPGASPYRATTHFRVDTRVSGSATARAAMAAGPRRARPAARNAVLCGGRVVRWRRSIDRRIGCGTPPRLPAAGR